MKKVLVLGSSSMFGHVVADYLDSLGCYKVDSTDDIEEIYGAYDTVINCQMFPIKESEANHEEAIYTNSYIPHKLAWMFKNRKTKIIHLSTNCVFNGAGSPYDESDIPNETNWYGRTRTLGELNDDKNLTIRLSEIGPELTPEGTNLFNWFMVQETPVEGYEDVYWNGLTSLELAKQLHAIIQGPSLTGVIHLHTPNQISKFGLLKLIKEIFFLDVELIPNSTFKENKMLVRTRKDYQPSVLSYAPQLVELREYIYKNKEKYLHYYKK